MRIVSLKYLRESTHKWNSAFDLIVQSYIKWNDAFSSHTTFFVFFTGLVLELCSIVSAVWQSKFQWYQWHWCVSYAWGWMWWGIRSSSFRYWIYYREFLSYWWCPKFYKLISFVVLSSYFFFSQTFLARSSSRHSSYFGGFRHLC